MVALDPVAHMKTDAHIAMWAFQQFSAITTLESRRIRPSGTEYYHLTTFVYCTSDVSDKLHGEASPHAVFPPFFLCIYYFDIGVATAVVPGFKFCEPVFS